MGVLPGNLAGSCRTPSDSADAGHRGAGQAQRQYGNWNGIGYQDMIADPGTFFKSVQIMPSCFRLTVPLRATTI